MTGRTAEKKATTTRPVEPKIPDVMQRALLVHTLAHTVYEHLARQHAMPFGWGQAPPPVGFHQAGPPMTPYGPAGMTHTPGTWAGEPTAWKREMPMVPPYVPGIWGG